MKQSDRRSAGSAQELLRRKEIRNNFGLWCREVGYIPAQHHQLMVNALEDLANGKHDRLALFMPPGSAKSTYASVLFPPWFMARHPQTPIIAASNVEELADRWGRRVRNLVEENAGILGLTVATDSRASGHWETLEGAEYHAAGVGGAIAGRRAGLAIIDDPIRNREDADSETLRQRQWEWWLFDLVPRLLPRAPVVLIQTRWHEDDLGGRILETEPGRWRIIKLPMEADDADDPLHRKIGERLWPEWFTDQMVADAKRDARVWSALYQQRPSPESGNYFKREWLHLVDIMPNKETLRIYGASDYAVTKDGGDFTVHGIIGLDTEGRPYLLDMWRQQASSDKWVDAWCDLVKHWRPLAWAEETGQIKAGVGPFLDRVAREKHAYTAREQFPTRHDKAVRAQSIRGYIAQYGLYIPRREPWSVDVVNEMMGFPAGKHDDITDMLGLIGQLLDHMLRAMAPKQKTQAQRSGYRVINARPSIPSMKVL